jgi:hypothetical protein
MSNSPKQSDEQSKTIVTGASLVARLEALQQLWRKEADVWSKKPGWHANSVVERQIWSGCADALDPILAKLRRLQSQESKEEEAARVDSSRLSHLGDLPQPATGDTSTRRIAPTVHLTREEREELEELDAAEERNQQATARILDLVTALAACEAREQGLKQQLSERQVMTSELDAHADDAGIVSSVRPMLRGSHDSDARLPATDGVTHPSHNTLQDLNDRLAHEADAVIALVHQQQIHAKHIAELERRVSTLSGLVNR